MTIDPQPGTQPIPVQIPEPTAPAHVGTVGLLQGSALYVASVLGTGILTLPALGAAAAGPASILAIIAVLIISVPLAGTFAVLASRYPDAGGVATFVRLALGSTAARVTGYWFLFGVGVGAPVVTILGGLYIGDIFDAPRWVVVLISVLLYVPPFISNAFGLRVSGRVQLGLTGLLVVVVFAVVASAVPAVVPENFEPFMPHGWAGVGLAISLFVWAVAGWEAVTHIAGEFKNPSRTIPLATGIAILTVGTAYLSLQVVTIGVLGSRAGLTDVPLLDIIAVTATEAGPVVVASLSAVTVIGVLNLYVGAFAKLAASLGRDGDLPKWFARGAEAGGVPRRALLAVAAIIAVYFSALVLTGLDLVPFVLINTACMVAVYALGMVAALRLLRRFSLGWWFAVVSCILVAGLLLIAGVQLLVPVGLAAAAVVVTLVKRRRSH